MTEELVVFEGLDMALIGTAYRGGHVIAVYDFDLIVEALKMEGMTEDEAYEFADYNIVGAWFGEQTPIVLFRNSSVF